MENKIKNKKYFLGLLVALVILFAFCCFSIIYCVINGSNVPSEKTAEHTMSFIYLFLHLIILAVLFFYALRAYLLGKSSFIQIITTKENGSKNKKTVITCSIIAFIAALIAVYFITVIAGIDSFGKMFSLGLQFALTNAGANVAILCLFIIFYKPDEIKK